MKVSATITIISGPDRGKMFRLQPGQFTIGRGEDNEIALTDSSLEEHQASILNRNGRVAIYSPLEDVVQVDGKQIPAGAWFWLPAAARVRIGDRTAFQFNLEGDQRDSGEARLKSVEQKHQIKETRQSEKPRRRKQRQTAQFITDQVGDPLVRLGEDGTLPELNLAESRVQNPREAQQSKRNPAVLYIALSASFCFSIALLLMDFEPRRSHSVSDVREARIQIRAFFGAEEERLEPYQKHLREAQRAFSSGDYVAELNEYRSVLRLLNSEDNDRSVRGLTGDKRRDEELRELIGILLTQ